MALNEPQNLVKPHNMKFFTGGNYELAINQSIHSILDSLQNPNPDFSVFTSTFLELTQSKPNPLLEGIWIISGLTYHIDNSPTDDLLDRLSAVKGSFQYITACSASCSPSICIAVIAPVIFKLYRILVDWKRENFDLKRGKKMKREIRSFLDVILGYFNVCCEGSNTDEGSGLIRPLIDLVSIWVHGERIENGAGSNGLKQFFPLLSDEIIEWISVEDGGVLELVAGAVIVEAFLLKLCLNFGEGSSREELPKGLKTWAVCSMTGFHNFYFFDMLLKMLLEQTLPVMSLLSSEDESFLRKMLYDVVILPAYSFLHPEKLSHLPNNYIKNNVLARLMMNHEAIALFRKNGDLTKAVSYTNAFSDSHLPTLLIKLVTSELGSQGRASQPNGSSPTALLKWILDLQNQGLRLSDGFILKYRDRFAHYSTRLDLEQTAKTDDDLQFFIDNNGNDEDERTDDSMNEAFVAAAHAMHSDTDINVKKRKESSVGNKKNGVKIQRLGLRSDKDGSGSTSEVEDPDSNEDQ